MALDEEAACGTACVTEDRNLVRQKWGFRVVRSLHCAPIMRIHSFAVAALSVALVSPLVGCGNTSRDAENTESQKDPVCLDAAPVPFHLLEPDADSASQVELSRCGYLRMVSSGRLLLADPSLGSVDAVHDAAFAAQFAPVSDTLLYEADGSLFVRDLATGNTRSQPDPGGALQVSQPDGETGVVLTCTESRLSLRTLALDLIASVDNVSCASLVTTSRGHHALARRQNALVSVDLSTGAVTELTGYDPWEDNDYSYATEAFYLSEDGQLALHHQQRDELCGDTMCGKTAEVNVFDALSGSTVASVPVGAKQCCGGLPEQSPWWTNARGQVLVRGSDATTFVDVKRKAHVLGEGDPLYLFAAGDRALFRREKSLDWAALPSGGTVQSTERPYDANHWAISGNEAELVVGQFTDACVRTPGTNICHTQIWQVARIGAKSQVIAYSDQPVQPYFIGNDGTVLAVGSLTLKSFPKQAEKSQLPVLSSGAHLIHPDGRLTPLSIQIDRVLEFANGLLVLGHDTSAGYVQTLHALNLKSGATVELLRAPELTILFDESRERLAVVARYHDSEKDRFEVWAGGVPLGP